MIRSVTYISLAVAIFAGGFSAVDAKKSCFNSSAHCKSESKLCNIKEFAFETHLSFDQVVIDAGHGVREHRPDSDRPGTGPSEVFGTFEICFDKTFEKAEYRLSVFNVDGVRNLNEALQGAFLYFGCTTNIPNDPPVNEFSNQIVSLCQLLNTGTNPDCATAIDEKCFCCTGTLTNDDLQPFEDGFPQGPSAAPTVARLFQLIRAGNVYVLVTGSRNGEGGCNVSEPGYSVDDGGLIRGQLFARQTGKCLTSTSNLNLCT